MFYLAYQIECDLQILLLSIDMSLGLLVYGYIYI